jgi:phosphoribosylformimino-5-aminoimidazole carboxamide ribonucleotide (ProFAR) isomerase
VARASDLAVLSALRAGNRELAGVIVGRALLAGSVSMAEAASACGS